MPTLNYNTNFKSGNKFMKSGTISYYLRDMVNKDEKDMEMGYIIDLNPKFSNGENLQRDLVWTLKQKQQLVLSILKRQKLPVFHISIFTDHDKNVNTKRQKTFKVIDGKQRLSTMQEFFYDEFPIEVNGVEYYHKDFDDDAKYEFDNFTLDVNVFYEHKYMDDTDNVLLTDQQLYEWFYLVNFAGTPQDEKHLEHLKKQI